MTIVSSDLQDSIGGLHIWFISAPLFPLESHVDFGNVSRPKHYVWCGQEWGLGKVGSQDFELRDSAHRPGRVMPLCKWAFPSSWFSTWISCKCKLELRREGENGFQCLHSSAVWDVFFKRKGQTSNDLRFTLARQSSTINWHLLQTQTSFWCKASLETSGVQAFLPPLSLSPFQVLPGNGPTTDFSYSNTSTSVLPISESRIHGN